MIILKDFQCATANVNGGWFQPTKCWNLTMFESINSNSMKINISKCGELRHDACYIFANIPKYFCDGSIFVFCNQWVQGMNAGMWQPTAVCTFCLIGINKLNIVWLGIDFVSMTFSIGTNNPKVKAISNRFLFINSLI